ncbi:crossover junction endodeoxyribonuclease RusA [Lactococcus lactis subsp. lactis bv. diacetylactis str. TIFN2]|uniref:RusA family crossover junction endodeoxyribonuclease n=1 Tax=Lactococcus lactis TaxID=1358 RepID=UPI00038A79CE|nr:RusA family crossover junction endodeoxyribonuclease [Lactococcus lactis]EQC90920.1 crossover junction endodeoxyribonuclease RusA [Lactococcus lactis subsp. lactis bv. diacetylactis str. TIFN4]EQC92883.1 crossover junction endodeoxyribonuclease RusA [Lactococcus lactis subsp. lactis bv. diacetylactis str. TIFN2]QGJ84496.1 crossover junction endodeoxyribonuclease [Lactococcus phage proPhi2]QGJ84545.1 crossover junction endodeoxyribonuclease [Lactococcus phage proPhi4]
MKFKFELDKMPTTQQQKGIKKVKGKLQFYDRRGTNNYSLKAQLMKNKPKECFEKSVPLKLSVTFFYAIKQENRWWKWKTSRPDLDNLMKNLQDYMTKLRYYSDDSQIVWLEAKKVNDEKNRIEIEITEV